MEIVWRPIALEDLEQAMSPSTIRALPTGFGAAS
jgi:hypothetical protein